MKKTQKSELLKYLQKHKKGISEKEAKEKFGIGNVSATVSKLRADGNVITCKNWQYKLIKGE